MTVIVGVEFSLELKSTRVDSGTNKSHHRGFDSSVICCGSEMTLRFALLLSTVCCAVLAAPTDNSDNKKGAIWAVLVAGSNDYYNYRHQADVAHAYQILHRHGIPDSNIIVMMYDDIANNPSNPVKGTIINKPGGPNVYVKVPKDYTGEQVTPENFIKVLTGNKTAPGKVLKSGPNDHVFINFVDHGSTGLIGFPDGYLYADQLIETLKTMHNKKMYNRLLFYMEACESGSMFRGLLPRNINIFATTAANPAESSYACYWDEKRQTYLGDEYSIAWMEDLDSEEHQKNMTTETLITQFKHVVKRVNDSHPTEYGHRAFEADHVTAYLGNSKKSNNEVFTEQDGFQEVRPFTDSVSSRDVVLQTLSRTLSKSNDNKQARELQQKMRTILEGRKEIDNLMSRILARVVRQETLKRVESSHQPLSLEMMPCYRQLVDTFNQECVNINKNTYALSHLYKLANVCVLEPDLNPLVRRIFSVECNTHHRALAGIN